ncbi:MAG: NAD(P)-dependent oxidoreductase [Planctomycetes bacterium]|nr:NAD(P)-dependent oxidoreductase [Planctomycetota bacterium]
MSNPHAKPVGIVGLGLMGAALAERLLAAGYDVRGYDRDAVRVAEFVQRGGVASPSAALLAAECEPILLSLPDESIVRAVLGELGSSLAPGATIVDTSTGDPRAAEALGAELAARGIQYLDATISGSSAQLRSGDVLMMVGGAADAFREVQPLLDAIVRQVMHTGPCGSGAKLKLVTNLVLGLNRAALAEGLAFAGALGLDLHRALEVLQASMAYSRIMDTKGQKMIDRDFTPQARLSQHLKDVRLMLAAAQDLPARLPLSQLHAQLLAEAEAAGLGSLDNSAIIEVFSRKADSHDN